MNRECVRCGQTRDRHPVGSYQTLHGLTRESYCLHYAAPAPLLLTLVLRLLGRGKR